MTHLNMLKVIAPFMRQPGLCIYTCLEGDMLSFKGPCQEFICLLCECHHLIGDLKKRHALCFNNKICLSWLAFKLIQVTMAHVSLSHARYKNVSNQIWYGLIRVV